MGSEFGGARPVLRIAAAVVMTAGCALLSIVWQADAKPKPIQPGVYAYVRAGGPFLQDGNPPPAQQIYEYQLLTLTGGLKLLGTIPANDGIGAISENGTVYVATPNAFEVFDVSGTGQLVDTGQSTGVSGELAIYTVFTPDQFPDSHSFAYILTEDNNGDQSIVEYTVDDSTGLFTQIGQLAGINNQGADEYFGLLAAGSNALYAPSAVSVGQFSIAQDGSLTQNPSVAVPGVDDNNGCGFLSNIPGTFLVDPGVAAYGLQQIGGSNPNCAPKHSGLVTFKINSSSGLLSTGSSSQLQTTQSQDSPGYLAFGSFGGFYASDVGETRNINQCTVNNQNYPIISGSGAQVVDGITGGGASVTSVQVDQWTDPTTSSCATAQQCADMEANGEGPDFGVPVAADPTGGFLLVGNPGLAVESIDKSGCVPYEKSIAQAASLQMYQTSLSGGLKNVASVKMGAGQVALNIDVFAPPSDVGVITGLDAVPPIVKFGDLLTDPIPQFSPPMFVTIKNDKGKTPPTIRIEDEEVTGSFKITSRCKQDLPAGKSCKVAVEFAPTKKGPAKGTLLIYFNSTKSPQKITLTGKGI